MVGKEEHKSSLIDKKILLIKLKRVLFSTQLKRAQAIELGWSQLPKI